MMFKGDAAKQMREMVKKGTFGFGVFECNDLMATYLELKEKGVVFKKSPAREFYHSKHFLLMTPVTGFHWRKRTK